MNLLYSNEYYLLDSRGAGWKPARAAAALKIILDKLLLAQQCTDIVRVPRTELFGPAVDPASWTYPVIVKPRTGSGSRGILEVGSAAERSVTSGACSSKLLPRSPSWPSS